MNAAAPELAVVVPSRDRPQRLRRLLDALAAQRAPRERWELVVATHGEGARLATDHPVGARVVGARSLGAAAQRNAGWRAARAGAVLFTDDDCRPPSDWVASGLEAARAHPGAIVQGATRPDPEERHLLGRRYARTQCIEPPVPWAQTCNILYPRAVLEACDGFEEALDAGEDTELALRARALTGAPYVAAPAMLTYHAVDAPSLRGHLRTIPRWGSLALVLRRQPQLRSQLVAGVFWKPAHAWLVLAGLGALLALRGRPLRGALLALPWARATPARRPSDLPGRAVVDAAEIVALARGSLRHRTLIL